MAIATILVVLGIIGAAAGGGDDGGSNEASSPPPPAAQEQPPPPPPPAEPREKPPPPIVLQGQGARVETLRLAKDSPAIFAALHRGSSNFALQLVGQGAEELLVNEIGNYAGEALYADAKAGRYRLQVTADGPWTVTATQPVPSPRAKRVPGTFTGTGSRVLKIQSEDDLEPIVTARHRGESNFAVYVVGYGDTTGTELLFNEIGNYDGQTLVTAMPEGSYLLAVAADGQWRINFAP